LSHNRIVKKYTIIKFLEEGGHSDTEIIRMTGSTDPYFRKVKSLWKTGKKLETNNMASAKDNNSHDILHKNKPDVTQVAQLKECDKLTRDERKAVWSMFGPGKTPADVIRRYGFTPEVIESEYKKYLAFVGRDFSGIQRNVLELATRYIDFVQLSVDEKKEWKEVTDKFSKAGELSNSQFVFLLDINNKAWFYRGRDSIKNASLELPKGLSRPTCKYCNGPLDGVVVNYTDPFGRAVIEDLRIRGWCHRECKLAVRQSNETAKQS
jgi:hypothetical protein